MKRILARLQRLPIKMSPFSLIFFLFLLWLEPSAYTSLPLLAALWHETGHAIALRLTGIRIRKIEIYPFGVEIQTLGVGSYRDDLLVSGAGCFANLLACAFCAPHLAHNGALIFFCANLTLALVNLCPVDTLDGGAILYAVLCRRYLPADAFRILRKVSFVTLICLWVVAVYFLFFSGCHFSFFTMILYLFVCLFLKRPSRRIYKES